MGAIIPPGFLMSNRPRDETDVVIAGGGLAGIVTALELLDHGRRVVLVDKDSRERFGGLAREAFGGVHLIDTPQQRRAGIHDSSELAWADWRRAARYDESDHWPAAWGRFYCEHSRAHIYEFLRRQRIGFLPVVNWPERGYPEPRNSVPRWHIVWGTGYEIVRRLLQAIEAHPNRSRLMLLFDTEVSGLDVARGWVTGVHGHRMDGSGDVRVRADHTVIASGGMCGGDLGKVRAHWFKPWGEPPPVLLNGAHRYGDGLLQDRAADLGAASRRICSAACCELTTAGRSPGSMRSAKQQASAEAECTVRARSRARSWEDACSQGARPGRASRTRSPRSVTSRRRQPTPGQSGSARTGSSGSPGAP